MLQRSRSPGTADKNIKAVREDQHPVRNRGVGIAANPPYAVTMMITQAITESENNTMLAQTRLFLIRYRHNARYASSRSTAYRKAYARVEDIRLT